MITESPDESFRFKIIGAPGQEVLELFVEDSSVSKIVNRLQNSSDLNLDPEDNLILTSETQISKNIKNYHSAFLKTWNNWRLYKSNNCIRTKNEHCYRLSYAFKANYNLKLLDIILNESANNLKFCKQSAYVTTVSANEIKACLPFVEKYRVKNAENAETAELPAIIFNGTAKKLSEIKYAIEIANQGKVNMIMNIDSIFDYQRIRSCLKETTFTDLDQTIKLLIRYNPKIPQLNNIHPYVATAIENSKFGVEEETCVEILRMAKNDGVRISGFHMHLGSTIKEPEVYSKALEAINRLICDARWKFDEPLIDLKDLVLNIGGGLGLDYQRWLENYDAKNKQCSAYDLVSTTVENPKFMQMVHDHNMKIILEPGRSLIGNASILLAKILGKKTNITKTKNFLITDISMSECIRPALYNAYHHIQAIETPAYNSNSKSELYDVVGPVCESGDFIGKNVKIFDQSVEKNKIIALFDVGAYCGVMGSNYNLRLRPAEFLVKKDGSVEIIAEREDLSAVLDRFAI